MLMQLWKITNQLEQVLLVTQELQAQVISKEVLLKTVTLSMEKLPSKWVVWTKPKFLN
jgi:hypothetical protein